MFTVKIGDERYIHDLIRVYTKRKCVKASQHHSNSYVTLLCSAFVEGQNKPAFIQRTCNKICW